MEVHWTEKCTLKYIEYRKKHWIHISARGSCATFMCKQTFSCKVLPCKKATTTPRYRMIRNRTLWGFRENMVLDWADYYFEGLISNYFITLHLSCWPILETTRTWNLLSKLQRKVHPWTPHSAGLRISLKDHKSSPWDLGLDQIWQVAQLQGNTELLCFACGHWSPCIPQGVQKRIRSTGKGKVPGKMIFQRGQA